MTNQVSHHGVKGQRWGVRRPDGPDGTVTGTGKKTERQTKSSQRNSSKSNQSSKPSVGGGAKTASRKAAENREAIMKEIETLRSMGNEAAAKKLEDQLKSLNEEPKTEESQAESAGDGEDKEEEEEKKGKGKGKAAAAAAPKAKPDPAIEAAKKEAERLKAERSKLQTLAKTQRETARAFTEAASEARSKVSELNGQASSISQRLPGFQKDLEKAQASGDKGAIKTIEEMINRLKIQVTNLKAESKAQQGIANSLSEKADEWNAKVDESLAEMAALDEDVKDKVKHGEDFLAHYGIKGMRWGVRRTAEQLGRVAKKTAAKNPREAQRQASKEAKTLSDKELRDRINRMNMEKQYSDLVKQQVERDRTALQEGQAEVARILGQKTKESIGNVYGKSLTYGLTKGANVAGIEIKTKK